MRTLAIDIETYSSVSLQKCGVYAYAQSPDFEILLFGYAWDDGPVEVIDLARGESLPEELQNALYDPEILKTAFNASFERTCLSAFMGRVTPPEQWSCTAVMARELGLPGSLEAVGEVIGLPEDKQKSKTGRALISYFSIPCKPTKTNGNRTRNLPEHDPDRWAIYVEYNRQDVVSERAIRQKLSRFPVYEKEQPLWIHDQHINDRGVGVDLNLAEHAVEIDAVIKARLLEQAKELTGLENPKSTAQLKSWIEDTAGIEVESLNKKSIAGVRADADCDAVDRISCDYGTLNPTSAGLWGLCEGKWYRVREYYYDGRKERYQRTDEEHYAAIEELAGDLSIRKIIVDPSAASFIEVIRRHDRFMVEQASNRVLDGIRDVATRLNAGDIFFCDCCTDCIREFGLYRWDEKAAEDRPLKTDDHAMDDTRYFVRAAFQPSRFSF